MTERPWTRVPIEKRAEAMRLTPRMIEAILRLEQACDTSEEQAAILDICGLAGDIRLAGIRLSGGSDA